MLKVFDKYKVKAKSFWAIAVITAIEMIVIIWSNDWEFNPAAMIPFIQFVMIFENKDTWKKLTEAEKEELTLSEDDLYKFIVSIIDMVSKGLSMEDILKKLKNEET